MKARKPLRAGRISALLMMALLLPGCAAGRYMYDRAADALDIVEVGVSVSTTPQFAFYWNSLDMLVFGKSDFDGYLVGWGGRHLGITRLYNKCMGLGVGREEYAFGDFDKNDPSTLRRRYGGLAGLPGLVGGVAKDGYALDSPACVHFFPHIGFVGLVWNVRWGQIVDFVVGWTTIDLGQDDSLPAYLAMQKIPAPVAKAKGSPPTSTPASTPAPTLMLTRSGTKDSVPRVVKPAPPTPIVKERPTPEPARQAVPAPSSAAAGRIHIVQKGDTLYGLSRTYFGTPAKWRDILEANRSVISDGNVLTPGMKLVIPEG